VDLEDWESSRPNTRIAHRAGKFFADLFQMAARAETPQRIWNRTQIRVIWDIETSARLVRHPPPPSKRSARCAACRRRMERPGWGPEQLLRSQGQLPHGRAGTCQPGSHLREPTEWGQGPVEGRALAHGRLFFFPLQMGQSDGGSRGAGGTSRGGLRLRNSRQKTFLRLACGPQTAEQSTLSRRRLPPRTFWAMKAGPEGGSSFEWSWRSEPALTRWKISKKNLLAHVPVFGFAVGTSCEAWR